MFTQSISVDKDQVANALKEAILMSEPKIGYTKLARKIDETYDRLYNMANGRTEPDPVVLEKVRKALGKPADWLKGLPEGRMVSIAGTPLAPVKVVGNVSGGSGAYNVDPQDELVYVPQTLANIGGLGWVVEGESMMPELDPGTIALFKEHRSPRRSFTFLVKAKDGDLRVKNLEWMDNEWTLVSLNPKYPPEPLNDHELLGYLIGWYKVKGKREEIISDPDGLILNSK